MSTPRQLLLLLAFSISCAGTRAPEEAEVESYAPIPESIRTPATMSTRLGELRFFDGLPSRDAATQQDLTQLVTQDQHAGLSHRYGLAWFGVRKGGGGA